MEGVLGSKRLIEVLGLHPNARGGGGGAATSAGAAREDSGDLEAAWCGGHASEDTSDAAVVEGFLTVGVQVHPFQNFHPESALALRWAAEAFCKFRGRRERAAASLEATAAQVFEAPLREQACPTSTDEAQRLFAEVVAATYDKLSLRNPEECCLSSAGGDALLKSLHLLHLQPHALAQPVMQRKRAILDTLLGAALAVNWVAVAITRRARIFSLSAARNRSESMASTTVVALGGVAFSSACRMHGVVSGEGAGAVRSLGAGPLEPLVRCPLCRVASPAGRAIRGVHAGEGAASCCVCTEGKADVCLPCGHLCICGECFQHLPRSAVAAE